MRSSVEISRSAAGEVVIACLAGDVDMVQVPKIQGALEAALADDASGLVIDLSAVQYFDSTGVRWLFDVQRKLQFSRHQFRLVVPEDGLVRHVLRIVNIDKFILVHPTAEAALAELAAAGVFQDAEA
jgi:anti-sigma B factor antagonist